MTEASPSRKSVSKWLSKAKSPMHVERLASVDRLDLPGTAMPEEDAVLVARIPTTSSNRAVPSSLLCLLREVQLACLSV